MASKRYRVPRVTDQNRDSVMVFNNVHANIMPDWNDVWLYRSNVEYWKHFAQKAFAAETFTQGEFENGKRTFNAGSLSLFSPIRKNEHTTFSHHIVSENKMRRFVAKKGWTEKWVEHSKNNHYLDALGYACAAAGVMGIELIKPQEAIETPDPAPQSLTTIPGITMPDGRPYSVLER